MRSKVAVCIRQFEREEAKCARIEALWQKFVHDLKEAEEVSELSCFAEFPDALEWRELEETIAEAKILIADHMLITTAM